MAALHLPGGALLKGLASMRLQTTSQKVWKSISNVWNFEAVLVRFSSQELADRKLESKRASKLANK